MIEKRFNMLRHAGHILYKVSKKTGSRVIDILNSGRNSIVLWSK